MGGRDQPSISEQPGTGVTILEAVAVLALAVSVLSLGLSFFVFVIQRRDMRRRELWWAVVENGNVEKGVPISFRTHRYIGKEKPKKRQHPSATVVRGYVVEGESRIGRERMSQQEATRYMQKRIARGEPNPEVPDEVHPPKITMVPLKVIRRA